MLSIIRSFIRVIITALMSTQATRMLASARHFYEHEDYEKASEAYVWFHINALRHNPGMMGVRLSYALSEWYELGDVYPPARTAMVQIRDVNETLIKQGSDADQLFVDVDAINELLEDRARTFELFHYLETHRPELAGRVFKHVDRALLEHDDLATFRRWVPDLKQCLALRLKTLNFMGAMLKGFTRIAGTAEEQTDAQIFASETVEEVRELGIKLATIAESEGNTKLAIELRTMSDKSYQA